MIDFEIPPLSIIRQQYLDLQNLAKSKNFNAELFENQMQHLVKILKGEIELDFEGIQSKMFKELNPINFTQDISKHKKIIGRKWVSQRIDDWILNNSKNRVLWLTADAGYGKSAIATHLANNNKNVIGIHYCSYNFPKKKNPINVIKTLAYQFQSQLSNYFSEIRNIEVFNKNEYELFEELILNPLNKLDLESTYIFIIDGLDEAKDDNGQNKLANLICDEFQKLPKNIKIIVTSRPEPYLTQKLKHLNPITLNTKTENNIEDCKDFIKYGLSKSGYGKYYVINFIEGLLQKSEYNMLYLTLFFESINNGTIDIDKPDKFPLGLNRIYESFFQRVTKDDNVFDNDIAQLFEIIISYGTISKPMLSDISNINAKKLKRILNKIGSLIIEDNNGRLNLYHQSLADWLTAKDNISYPIDLDNGKSLIDCFLYKILKSSKFNKDYFIDDEFNTYISYFDFKTNGSINEYKKCITNNLHKLNQKELRLFLQNLLHNQDNRYAIYWSLSYNLQISELTSLILSLDKELDIDNNQSNEIIIVNNINLLVNNFRVKNYKEGLNNILLLSNFINDNNRSFYINRIRDYIGGRILLDLNRIINNEIVYEFYTKLITLLLPFYELKPNVFFIKMANIFDIYIPYSNNDLVIIENFIDTTLNIIKTKHKTWSNPNLGKTSFNAPLISPNKEKNYKYSVEGAYYTRNTRFHSILNKTLDMKIKESNISSLNFINKVECFFENLYIENNKHWTSSYITFLHKKEKILFELLSKKNSYKTEHINTINKITNIEKKGIKETLEEDLKTLLQKNISRLKKY